jgi:hypothetical protein
MLFMYRISLFIINNRYIYILLYGFWGFGVVGFGHSTTFELPQW